MSSPAFPATAENAPSTQPTPTVRRSFTLPSRIANRPRPPLPSSRESADGIETLFTHTFTKIISFTTGPATGTPPPNSRRSIGATEIDTPGTLQWKSYTERTLAVGPLRVYRVISSNVSFLNSGNFLHTIFPKSQCWCVDGECKFVLRIRPNTYYRIELPFETDEDKEKITEFKTVLDKVLRYEKTACPFARGFEVDIPEAPATSSPIPKRLPKPTEKAKKWHFDKTWVPERGQRPGTEESDSATTSSLEEDDRSSVDMSDFRDGASDSPVIKPAAPAPQVLSVPERAQKYQVLRSVTAPIDLLPSTIASTGPTQVADSPEIPDPVPSPPTTSTPELSPPADTVSIMSSADSFYSFAKTISRTPSPQYMDAQAHIDGNPWVEDYVHRVQNEYGDDVQTHKAYEDDTQKREDPVQDIPTRGRDRHRRQVSDVTVRAPSIEQTQEPMPVTPTIDVRLSSAPSTPPLVSDSDDSLEPPFLDVPTPPDTIRLRRLTGATQRRAFSPMPPPQNLFRPPVSQAPRKQFTAALVRKTCEIILGPPAHLVALMLRIAAKVTDGAARFNNYRFRRSNERMAGSWESSDEEWEEDDYGIPLRTLDEPSSTTRNRAGSSGLEVD